MFVDNCRLSSSILRVKEVCFQRLFIFLSMLISRHSFLLVFFLYPRYFLWCELISLLLQQSRLNGCIPKRVGVGQLTAFFDEWFCSVLYCLFSWCNFSFQKRCLHPAIHSLFVFHNVIMDTLGSLHDLCNPTKVFNNSVNALLLLFAWLIFGFCLSVIWSLFTGFTLFL